MKLSGWAITAGLGAAAGAVAVMMMPRQNPVRRMAAKAANKQSSFHNNILLTCDRGKASALSAGCGARSPFFLLVQRNEALSDPLTLVALHTMHTQISITDSRPSRKRRGREISL